MSRYNLLQATEDITTGVASAQSSAAPSNTTHAILTATAACRVRTGANPTALATDLLVPASVPVTIPCPAGLKVAAIQEAAAGKCNVAFIQAW